MSVAMSEQVNLAAEVTDGLCGELGRISLVATGGNGDFEYSEDNAIYSTVSTLNNLEAGEFVFYLRDSDGCFDTIAIDVAVYGIPQIESEISPALCEEPVGTVTLEGKGGKGDLEFSKSGEPYSTITFFQDLSPGNLTFSVRDASGCTSEQEISIPSTPPVAIEDIDAEQLFCGDVLGELTYVPLGGTGLLTTTIRDTNGEIIDATNGLPAGRYTLIVEDEIGCSTSASILTIQKHCTVYVPNMFDPSSTGVDGTFGLGVPAGSNFTIASFQIYDRWGNLLYNQENIDPLTFKDWWDGSYKGKQVAQGVYVYYIQLDGESTKLTGTITVVR